MSKKIFSVTKENYTIYAETELVNKDLLVNITGGNVPHLGGVVTWDVKTKKQCKVEFASHDGRKHKDIFLAERFAKRIEKKLPGNLCVTAGVHIDNITEAQINASFPMTDNLADQVLVWTLNQSDTFKKPQYTTHIPNFKLKK
ncbi:hypothetical protein [uncultured Lactobacillus sp.]|uniref:prenylated flavin chaperone LpdD n=1 Tax=uncultured Lactobacillus sp. TaxID=153152 RepID=UPI002803FA3E|nr:hypothetical protein [uncultured Lactobacillus sp.]